MVSMSTTSIIPFAVEDAEIEGLKVLRMKQVTDERGTAREMLKPVAVVEGEAFGALGDRAARRGK
jgi:dTDP-4-dehydrorhamnose 3,5-epimerase-like enzyme